MTDLGYSVAVSGDTVVVGAYYEDSCATGVNGDETNNAYAATPARRMCLVRSRQSTWSQQAYLKASDGPDIDDLVRPFGCGVRAIR